MVELRWQRTNARLIGFSGDLIVAWLSEGRGGWDWHLSFANESGFAVLLDDAQTAAQASWSRYSSEIVLEDESIPLPAGSGNL